MEAIVQAIVLYCGCNFTEHHVTDGEFQCFLSFPRTVSYHAKIRGTPQVNAPLLITALQEWADSVKTIIVQFMPLSVERFCTVTSGFSLEECPPPNIAPTVNQSKVPTVTVAFHVIVVTLMTCIVLWPQMWL